MSSFPNFEPTEREYQSPAQPRQRPVWSGRASQSTSGAPPPTTPRIDVVDNSDEIWVYVDAPGFKPEELEIRGDDHTLLVTGERPSELEEGRNVLVHERSTRIERTIPLPATVDVSEADATYEDGVCKVTLPKTAVERYRDIELHAP